MISIVLICAVLASLAAGVLLAYAVCVWLFRVFRIHAEQASAERQTAKAATTAARA